MPLDLTHFLSSAAFPHTAEIAVGGGNKLAITFRAADPARAQAAILAAVSKELTALGFDPLVALKAAAGQLPKGEAAQAFKTALEALDADGEAKLGELMQKAEGASIVDVVGSFAAILPSGKREAVSGEVTAEGCAALPADLKRAITAAVSSAQLPVDKLDFLGQSPRS